MKPTLMVVNPLRPDRFGPPPWHLLDEDGHEMEECEVNKNDTVMCIGEGKDNDNGMDLMEVVHLLSDTRGFLERGLLRPAVYDGGELKPAPPPSWPPPAKRPNPWDKLRAEFPAGTRYVTSSGIEYVAVTEPWPRELASGMVPTVTVRRVVNGVESEKKEMIALKRLKKKM